MKTAIHEERKACTQNNTLPPPAAGIYVVPEIRVEIIGYLLLQKKRNTACLLNIAKWPLGDVQHVSPLRYLCMIQ